MAKPKSADKTKPRTAGRLANPVMSAPARLTLAPTSDLFVLGTGAAIERRSREEGENKVQTHTPRSSNVLPIGLLLRISAIGRSILLTKPTAAPAAPAACGFKRKGKKKYYMAVQVYIHKIQKNHHHNPATPIAATSPHFHPST